MTDMTAKEKVPAPLAALAGAKAGAIVYVREVREDELPDGVKTPASGKIYAIHDGRKGARLALTDDRGLAFRLARKHDQIPVSVH